MVSIIINNFPKQKGKEGKEETRRGEMAVVGET